MMPVAVLAGGLGTRVSHRTGDRIPKVMLPVAGVPFIDHKLRELCAAGASRVVMLVGHRGSSVIDHVGDGSAFGLSVSFVVDPPGLAGTGGALKRALPVLGPAFFVTYGDTLLDVPLPALESHLVASGRLGVMSVLENADRWEISNVDVSDGRVTTYERPARAGVHRFLDYGMLALRAAAFDIEVHDGAFDLGVIIEALIRAGQLLAFPVGRRFYDIGNERSIIDTEIYLTSCAER